MYTLAICGRCGRHEGYEPDRLRCLECRDPQVSQCKQMFFSLWWFVMKMPLGSKITLLPNDMNYREPQKCIRPKAPPFRLSLLSFNLDNQSH